MHPKFQIDTSKLSRKLRKELVEVQFYDSSRHNSNSTEVDTVDQIERNEHIMKGFNI